LNTGVHHISELANAYAALFGIVPKGDSEKCMEYITNMEDVGRSTPLFASIFYLASSVFDNGKYLISKFKDLWISMPSIRMNGTISELWDDTISWGTRCQNAPVPAYLLPQVILGVKPMEPGFKKFTVEPSTGGLTWAKGTVPTPYGVISVEWENSGNEFSMKVDVPSGFILEQKSVNKYGIEKNVFSYIGDV
jgi:hypothetical protein